MRHRVKIDVGLGGSTLWSSGRPVDPSKSVKMGLGEVLDYLQLIKQINTVIFDILHFTGKISKYDPLGISF